MKKSIVKMDFNTVLLDLYKSLLSLSFALLSIGNLLPEQTIQCG